VTGLDPYILARWLDGSLPVFSLIVRLGGMGVRRLERHERRLAGRSRHWRGRSRSRSSWISNYINPWIVDIGASLISMGCLILFLKVWQPGNSGCRRRCLARTNRPATMAAAKPMDKTPLTQTQLWSALLPWIIVCVVMLIWGTGAFKTWANSILPGTTPFPECTI